MANRWFVMRGGKELGPYSGEQLKRMAASGQLDSTEMIRREDMRTPRQARAIKGLFPDIHQKVGQAADAVGRTGETVKKVAVNVGKVADAVNEVAGATEKLRQAATSIAGIAGGISAFAGSIGDFLRPLGNINLGVFLIAGGTTPVFVFLARRQTTITQKFKYGAAAVVALAVAVIFGLWTGLAAVASKGDKGVLASNVKPIDRLQEAVVPVREVPPPVAAPKPPAPQPKDDPTLLQGRWYAVSEEAAGKDGSEEAVIALDKIADVAGGRMRIERTIGDKRDFYDGTFRLEPSATPKLFDWEGRGPGDGQVEMHGIYELSDDTFKLCFMIVPKGAEYTRPKEYRTFLGSRRVYNTFKRSPLPKGVRKEPSPKPGIDLLKRIDLKRDVIRGDWRMVDGGLRVKSADGDNGAALLLPYPLKGSYTLHLTVRREEAFGGMVLPIICSGKQFGAYLSGGWKGSSIPVTTERREVDFFPTNEKIEITCVVRPEGVVITNNDEAKIEWSDWSSLRGTGRPGDIPENTLWIKVFSGVYTFYEIRLVLHDN